MVGAMGVQERECVRMCPEVDLSWRGTSGPPSHATSLFPIPLPSRGWAADALGHLHHAWPTGEDAVPRRPGKQGSCENGRTLSPCSTGIYVISDHF